MYREKDARRYAELAVRQGINLQKGQTLLIRASVECAEFARMLVEAGYQAGAGSVELYYSDQAADRLRYQYADAQVLEHPAKWLPEVLAQYLKEGAAIISVVSADPDGFNGLDMGKVGRALNAQKMANIPYREQIDKNENQWLVIGAAAPGWARKVFPDEPEDRAMEKLWDAIYHTMRVDLPDPQGAWKAHTQDLLDRGKALNESGVVSLRIHSGLGTDLTMDLVKNPVWAGGASTTVGGIFFNANMPTEEVFTAPHRAGVNGKVVASMPLNYQGSLIDGFSFTLKDGLVVDYAAEQGQEALELMLAADEGCKRLGEVALVPYGSLIQETGILFYSTLYDENASCHIALGSAYASCSQGALEMTPEERKAAGINESVSHVDFMFGTPDLSVVGVRADGSTLQIFKDGQWAF